MQGVYKKEKERNHAGFKRTEWSDRWDQRWDLQRCRNSHYYEFKKTFLDNKQGRIGLLMKEMRNVPNDQKAEFGKTINGAKEWANQFFDELDQKLKEKEQQQR